MAVASDFIKNVGPKPKKKKQTIGNMDLKPSQKKYNGYTKYDLSNVNTLDKAKAFDKVIKNQK